jgi:competence protein ComEC
VGRWGAARIRVLHPPEPDWERRKVRNDDSVVLEIRIGRVVFILPGDAGNGVEPAIVDRLERDPAGQLTVVKVPHHGSAGSSSALFVDGTRPAIAVVSAGRRNPFGHPTALVLERYRAVGADIFRTDEEGEVIVDTDGEQLAIGTWTGRRRVLTVSRRVP